MINLYLTFVSKIIDYKILQNKTKPLPLHRF